MPRKTNTYAKHIGTETQTEPVMGKNQVQNNAGGFVFEVTPWTRLDRFLILGTEGGTYYTSEKKLTLDNAKFILDLVNKSQADGQRVIDRITQISLTGRAPKNDPALFALALVAKKANEVAVRQAAQCALTAVARTGTHLFHFAEYVKALGGWGRGTKHAFADWYNDMDADKLALQLIKYQQRDGWSHRDILRKVHVSATNKVKQSLYWYTVNGAVDISGKLDDLPEIVSAFEELKVMKISDAKKAIKIITKHRMPHECVPGELKNLPEVWEAMLPSMGMEALVRNLAKMTSIGLLKPGSEAAFAAAERLSDVETVRKSKLHPFKVLVGAKTYAKGHGDKGKLVWTPVQGIVDALDRAFYSAFANVEPTKKRHMLCLDVSGSMGSAAISNVNMSAREASAAMALVTANVESKTSIYGFGSNFSPLSISPKQNLGQVCNYMSRLDFQTTDCSLPMIYAAKHKLPVDAFFVYTDNETYAGVVHPFKALLEYRQKMGIGAKLVVVGMTATDFTIADPADAGMMDVVGFDSSAPQIMADFVRE